MTSVSAVFNNTIRQPRGDVPGRPSGSSGRLRSILATREGWIATALLLTMILSTVASVDRGRWATGTEIVYGLAIGAFVVGGVLLHVRVKGPIALALGLVLGLTVVYVQVGHLLPPVEDWSRLARMTARGTWIWLTDPVMREASAKGASVRSATGAVTSVPPLWTVGGAFVAFGNGAADFGYRIALWVQQGSSGKAVTDNTVFLMTIGVIAWVQGLAGAWGLYRRQDVVLASLPTAIVLGTNATYTGDARAPFAIFLITLLLLAVTLNVASLQRRWHVLNVAFPSGLLFDVTVSSFVVICGLALLALMGPRLGENPVSNAFWEYMGEQWTDMENASNRFFSGVNNPQKNSGAGRDRLTLSGPVKLTQRIVMTIASAEPEYWRGASYDVWTGKEWITSDRSPVTRTDKQPVIAGRFTRREKITADITIQQSKSDLLYVPDEPTTLSVSYRMYAASPDAAVVDFSAIRARRPAIPSLRYQVDAFASRASAEELRAAPLDNPEWVKRYTQLPDVPQKVRDLALTLGRGRKTAYDRATTVEQFLRRYPYTLDIKAVPADRDAVEYFLFDSKQGYCDYFATSMVVLLRAQGVPARLATGYVTGTLDPTSGQYIITEEEAHSWPEVYFPTYGWIAFEPSGYRPAIVRPEVPVSGTYAETPDCYEYGYSTFGECGDNGDPSTLVGPIADDQSASFVPGFLDFAWSAAADVAGWVAWAITGVIGAIAVGVGAYRYGGDYLERRRPPREAVLHAYWQLTFFARLIGFGPAASQTPMEFAASLDQRMNDAFTRPTNRFMRQLREAVGPPTGTPGVIAAVYARTLYGGAIPTDQERRSVEETWRNLRWRMPFAFSTRQKASR